MTALLHNHHKNLKNTLTYITIILLLASCYSDRQTGSDEMPPLYPAPITVALNTEEAGLDGILPRSCKSSHDEACDLVDTYRGDLQAKL